MAETIGFVISLANHQRANSDVIKIKGTTTDLDTIGILLFFIKKNLV
jgi:hypothetical protein